MKKYKLFFIIFLIIAVCANIPRIGFDESNGGFYSNNPENIVYMLNPGSFELNPVFWLPVFIQNPQGDYYYHSGLVKDKNIFAKIGQQGEKYIIPAQIYFEVFKQDVLGGMIHFIFLICYWSIFSLVLSIPFHFFLKKKSKKI